MFLEASQTADATLTQSGVSRDRLRRLLNAYPLSRRLFECFPALEPHPGYSPARDIHLSDQDFPGPITCTPSEGGLLFALADIWNPRRPLEIGSFIGWSTAHIASALKTTQLQCIEPFLVSESPETDPPSALAARRFRENIARSGCQEKVRLIPEPSPTSLMPNRPEGGWDFVFLDGWHNDGQPLRDVEGLLPCLAAKALVILHDTWIPDVRDAMLRLLDAGFLVYSLDTANYIGVCVRGEDIGHWEKFRAIALEKRHVLDAAQALRRHVGLSVSSIQAACDALRIGFPDQYRLLS